MKTERFPEGSKSKNGECSEKPKDFDLEEVGLLNDRRLAKKGLTVRGGGAIIINVVARTAKQTERATAGKLKSKPKRSLKTIQRKVILYKK